MMRYKMNSFSRTGFGEEKRNSVWGGEEIIFYRLLVEDDMLAHLAMIDCIGGGLGIVSTRST